MIMGFDVCIGNYGYYNEGELHDQWLSLPVPPEVVTPWLQSVGLYDREHEEIYISDYDGVPFGVDEAFGEYTRLEDLNLLAALMEEHDVDMYDPIITAACEQHGANDVIEIANIVAQKDDIYYFPAEDDIDVGAYVLEEFYPELAASIDNTIISAHIDLAGIGRDYLLDTGEVLGDGYCVNANEIELDRYTRDDLMHEVGHDEIDIEIETELLEPEISTPEKAVLER